MTGNNGKTTRFRLYGESERQKVHDVLMKAVSAWAAEWLAPGARAVELNVTPAAGGGYDAARWLVVRRHDTEVLGVREPRSGIIQSLVTGLSVAESGGDQASELVGGLVEKVLQELVSVLARALDIGAERGAAAWSPEMPRREEIGRLGAGWMTATCEWGAVGAVQIVIAPEAVARVVDVAPAVRGSGASLQQRRGAIDDRRVEIQVVLGEAELEVADLETLAPGDVIRLDRRLGDPLLVRNDAGNVLCGAHVGAVAGRRAVQLVTKR